MILPFSLLITTQPCDSLGGELRWPNDSISKQFPFIKLGKPQAINTTQAPKYLHLGVNM